MHVVTWIVRLILLMVLTAGLVVLFFIVKETLKELSRGSR